MSKYYRHTLVNNYEIMTVYKLILQYEIVPC